MLTMEEARQALATGVLKANDEYARWSGGSCIHDVGAESLATASIARALYEATISKDGENSCFVTLETPFKSILEHSGAVRSVGRPPEILRGSSRCDVVYYTRNDRPVGVVEVKRHFSYEGSKLDLQRITTLIRQYGTIKSGRLRWGGIAALRQRWQTDKVAVQARLDDFITKAESDFSGFRFIPFSQSVDVDPSDSGDSEFLGYSSMVVFIRPARVV